MEVSESTPRARILIVEDENFIAQNLATQLKNIGYEVVDFATSGKDAIEAAIQHQPDLIVMDIGLEGKIDGIEAASRIFQEHNIPSIFLTAYTDDETIKRAEHSGSYGYILKPYRLRELDAALRVALQKHRQQSKILKSFHLAEELGHKLQSELQQTSQQIKGVSSEANLEADLQMALQRGQFEVYYQPIIDITAQTIVGAEALIRWKHPQSGMISPEIFIPMAEKNQLITTIGNWVLKTACHEATTWQKLYPSPLRVSVNLSPVQLHKSDSSTGISGEQLLITVIEKVLSSSCLPPHLLMLEITENSLMENKFVFIEMIHKLQSMGVRLAIDDFGTGYSSLSYLQRFPFNVVKLDRSFVSNCFQDTTRTSIIKAVIQLAKNLNMRIIAEGVEVPEEAQLLLREGCTLAQGYLYSRPISAPDFKQFLSQFQSQIPLAPSCEALLSKAENFTENDRSSP